MKKIFLIICFVLFLLLVSVFVLSLTKKRNPKNNIPFFTTPTPIQINSNSHSSSLQNSVISLFPKNNAQSVGINTPIQIVFAKPLDEKATFFSISPETDIKTSFSSNKITITPTNGWDKATTYAFFIYFTGLPSTSTYVFTTEGVTPGFSPFVGDNGSLHAAMQEKTFNPDVFLSGYTPYENDGFSVESALTSSENGHYYFLVNLKNDPHTSLQSFYAWLSSLSFSQSQIQNLDIRFTQPVTGTQDPNVTPPDAIDGL